MNVVAVFHVVMVARSIQGTWVVIAGPSGCLNRPILLPADSANQTVPSDSMVIPSSRAPDVGT